MLLNMVIKPQSIVASKSATTTKKASSGLQTRAGELKLNLACGDRPLEDFINVDKFKTSSTDKLVDLLKFPWPWKSNSVSEVVCSHFFEHIPKELRPKFMEELYRVMKEGAKAFFITPWAWSNRSIQDFTHEWPPIVPESFLYFNKEWRKLNKLEHGAYDIKVDFDFGYGFALSQDIQVKSQEVQSFSVKNYLNSVVDLHVTLTKR